MKATQVLRTLTIGLLGFLCCAVLIGSQGVHAAVSIPQVIGPIPVTRYSHPFNAASHTNTPLHLSQSGYVEEEYFVSGYANVYDFVHGKAIVRTPDAPYTTRILVRRPVNASEFSGTVIVELLNPTAGFDSDIQWRLCHDYFLAHGDAWVGITSKPVAVQSLKEFDQQRYAPLSWDNPLPLSQTCLNPYSPPYAPDDSSPHTENGLIWDIMSQVGALLKKPPHTLVSNDPMQGLQVERVFATGYSQTSEFLVTYINYIRPHPNAHLDDGTPVYDGYLLGDGDGGAAPLNQCDESFEWGDERIIIQPRPEPVISVVTQTLVPWSRPVRREDSSTSSDRYRRYEVPGACHINKRQMDFSPSREEMEWFPGPPPIDCIEVKQYGLSDFPLEYIMNGAFANLDAWVRDPQGHIPPEADRIKLFLDASGNYHPDLDQDGNARGGVRTPYVDVPIATYYVHSTPPIGSCGLMGYKVPFDDSSLKDLYCICFWRFCFSCNRYVPKVEDAVDALKQEGYITEADGERIITEAEAIQSHLPYLRGRHNLSPLPPEPGP
jgi:hypothetical protein